MTSKILKEPISFSRTF
uniref:Uncharacterized protein n=1 Tax=Lepeophtheirus salmonis TaxID=72036 RepID=A0A0K2V042_LEPSM